MHWWHRFRTSEEAAARRPLRGGGGSGGRATLAQLRATSPRRASRDRGRE